MKKVIIAILALGGISAVAYTLASNKEQMQEKAKIAQKTMEYIPVETTHAEQMSVTSNMNLSGVLEAETDMSILSETQGQVVQVFKEKGDKVRTGDVLAKVESDMLQVELAAAESNYERLKADFDRFQILADKEAVTSRQLEEVRIGLKSAEAQYKGVRKRLEKTTIRATVDGVILEDHIQKGSFVTMGMRLYDVVDVSKLRLNVKLTAAQVMKTKVGDAVKVTLKDLQGKEFTAKVVTIAPKADASLKYPVELLLVNDGEVPLRAGLYASAHFDEQTKEESLYLSRNALVGSLQSPSVFVVQDSTVALRDITLGKVEGDLVEVLSGIQPTDEVVLSGQINLQEGTRVRVM